ncbi:hypothetical protein [Euryhalocaulis caribicus]|uniref:hypothetical protein n=1 Tax=Euryhalocaulis caribicus TaxID=1161401 RepID=UPI0012689FAC|nr:hypothetical protein [Euryhalocaulis caribicus]
MVGTTGIISLFASLLFGGAIWLWRTITFGLDLLGLINVPNEAQRAKEMLSSEPNLWVIAATFVGLAGLFYALMPIKQKGNVRGVRNSDSDDNLKYSFNVSLSEENGVILNGSAVDKLIFTTKSNLEKRIFYKVKNMSLKMENSPKFSVKSEADQIHVLLPGQSNKHPIAVRSKNGNASSNNGEFQVSTMYGERDDNLNWIYRVSGKVIFRFKPVKGVTVLFEKTMETWDPVA